MDLDLSVVVPAHNAEPFLAETLAALGGQTTPPREVIVVDDGSSDATGEVAGSFTFGDGSHPTVIRHREALGVAAARNHGAARASGAWIGFCDADDLWHARRIEATLALATDRPEARAIATDVVGFALATDRTELEQHPRSGMVNEWIDPSDLVDVLTRTVAESRVDAITLADLQDDIVFPTTSVSYRRDALALAGGCAGWSHLADDYVLNVAVAGAGPILVIRAPLLYYRVRPRSLSHLGTDIAGPFLAANLAARYGVATPATGRAGHLYVHMLREQARAGASLRRLLGFALLGDLSVRSTLGIAKASLGGGVRRRLRTDEVPGRPQR